MCSCLFGSKDSYEIANLNNGRPKIKSSPVVRQPETNEKNGDVKHQTDNSQKNKNVTVDDGSIKHTEEIRSEETLRNEDAERSKVESVKENEVVGSENTNIVKAPATIIKKEETIKKKNVKQPKSDSESEEVQFRQPNNEEKVNDQNSVNLERRQGVIPLSTNFDDNAVKEIVKYPKNAKISELLKTAISKNDFLNKFINGKLLDDVVDAMYQKDIKTNETVIREGDHGSHMYVCVKGRFEVSIGGKGVVNTFDDVRVFGELAILYNAKRNATIRSLKSGSVWVLNRDVYQTLMIHSNIKEQDEMLRFLEHVPKLRVVGTAVLQKVTALLQVEYFSAGTEIVRQGEKGDKFYIIRAGAVTITRENEGVVARIGVGKYFGELALLKEDVRQATVTADSPGVECLTLQRQHFIDHFGELGEEGITSVPTIKKVSEPISQPDEFTHIKLRDLDIVTTLGVGGFGRVELVRHRLDRTLIFALKYLKKSDMVAQNQQEHVYNEKNLQMACHSRFIIRLYKTYKDRKYIYFLMESCMGGDLWTLLQRQKLRRFDEKDARFIACCVLEAFSYLHDRGIVYRDLKPENLLIDLQGYIKLTDFGFAKKLGPRGVTFTFAGTPEYVAPEIILGKGHDKAVDYWAYGIFIFELLTGRTPFRTNDSSHMKTYNNIVRGIVNIEFPQYVPHKARDIIKKLCKDLPTERLGCQRNGVKDIREHKWFLGFDWNLLGEGKVHSPFKPKLKSKTDTTYFDSFKRDNYEPPNEDSGWDKDF